MQLSEEDYQFSSYLEEMLPGADPQSPMSLRDEVEEVLAGEDPPSSMNLPGEGTSFLPEDSQLAPFSTTVCSLSVTPLSSIHASVPLEFVPPSDEEVRRFLSSKMSTTPVLEMQEHTLFGCDSSIEMGEVIQVSNSSGPHVQLHIAPPLPNFSTLIPSEGGSLKTCSKSLSLPTYILVEIPGNSGVVPLSNPEIIKEIQLIIGCMVGKASYGKIEDTTADILPWLNRQLPGLLRDLQEKVMKDIENALPLLEEADIDVKLQKVREKLFFPLRLKMKRNGHPIFPQFLSSLPGSLRGLQEKSNWKVTLEEVKHVAAKLVYFHLKQQKQKIAAHPQHIRDLPREWRLENPTPPGQCYVPKSVRVAMAKYCGLETKQVDNLFHNGRKREVQKISLLRPHLKGHFPHHITRVLREWKARNPQQIPKGNDLKALMDATKLNAKQIRDWFGNHNRDRSATMKHIE